MKTGQRFDVAVAFLSSARFITALTTAAIGTVTLAFLLRQTIGWAGLVGILCGLLALFAIVLVMKRGEIEWSGLLPISLMVFVGWAVLSVFFSQYQWATLGSLGYFLAVAIIAVSIALLRDTIQIVRAFGDVLRVALVTSLIIELISGVLIDTSIGFLDVAGNLATLGPLQGVFGTRNLLGVAAVVALITFATEWRTKSVRKGVSVLSVVTAVACLGMSQSPVAIGATGVVGIATLALYGLRRVAPERRRFWQFSLLAAVAISGVLAWVFRTQLIQSLDATSDLSYRLRLWRSMFDLIPTHPVEGWGWIGIWRSELAPFLLFGSMKGGVPLTGANAYFDVWFQLGIVGILSFLVLITLAFTRSWLLASQRRSIVFAWPALVLVALITVSLAESSVLVDFGWFTLVVCTVKASRELSWRQAFTAAPGRAELPHDPHSTSGV